MLHYITQSGDAGPYILPISLKCGEPEVGRLERRRTYILNGVRKVSHLLQNTSRSVLTLALLSAIADRAVSITVAYHCSHISMHRMQSVVVSRDEVQSCMGQFRLML
jgi:hypothetical protein